MKYLLPLLIAIVLLVPAISFADEPEEIHRAHPSSTGPSFFFAQIKDLLPITLDEQTKVALWNIPEARQIIMNIWRIKTFGY